METLDTAVITRALPLCEDLEQSVFQKFLDCFTVEKHPSGTVILEQGDCQNKFFIVKSGIVHRIQDGRLHRTYEEGTIEGFHHFVSRDPSPATIKCITEAVVYSMTTDVFTKLLLDCPELTPCLLKYLSRAIRKHMKYLSSLSAAKGVRIALFDSKRYWEKIFDEVNQLSEGDTKSYDYELRYLQHKLEPATTAAAQGAFAVCVFVNDVVDRAVIQGLYREGVKLIALRCAGYNNVDLAACKEYGISVVRVPAYSPYAVAEHAVALMLTINRKTHKAYSRTKDVNFSLDGLVGFDVYGKTVGVFGTGKIGRCFINIMKGFGAKVLSYDKFPQKIEGVESVTFEELVQRSDIVSIHAPLTPETTGIFDEKTFKMMKKGAILINTSRGGLVNTKALIGALESAQLGGAGLDVYENEKAVFFEDHSDHVLTDSVLARLSAFNNVILTGHQAFLTHEALFNIAQVTLENIRLFLNGTRDDHPNLVKSEY